MLSSGGPWALRARQVKVKKRTKRHLGQRSEAGQLHSAFCCFSSCKESINNIKMPPSRLDGLYRSLLLTKFFCKGWGKPENIERYARLLRRNRCQQKSYDRASSSVPQLYNKNPSVTDQSCCVGGKTFAKFGPNRFPVIRWCGCYF